MNWNLNSLAKENFQCIQLIEAHNSIFNYDLISICETSLNDSVELSSTLRDEYTLCLLTILPTQDIVGWVFSTKILFQLE